MRYVVLIWILLAGAISAQDSKDGSGMADKVRVLFDSMVISPANKKRSVYLVRAADLSNALNSLERNNIELEHVFDF